MRNHRLTRISAISKIPLPEECKVFNPVDFDRVSQLKNGGFGQLEIVQNNESREFFVKKTFRFFDDPRLCSMAEAEVKVNSSVTHPNIVKCLGVYSRPGTVCFLLEQMAGDMTGFKSRDEKELASISFQVLKALKDMSILHLDVKPGNILRDGNRSIFKLADFGKARVVPVEEEIVVKCGTTLYTAPEATLPGLHVLASSPAATGAYKVDVFCFGLSMLEIFHGWYPLRNVPSSSVHSLLPSILKTGSEELKSFLSNCLKTNPIERMCVEDLITHPFIVQVLYLLGK
ncbi:hypothetical protein OROHE_002647 [Orobanche hederae]